jgi:hypothetical protein
MEIGIWESRIAYLSACPSRMSPTTDLHGVHNQTASHGDTPTAPGLEHHTRFPGSFTFSLGHQVRIQLRRDIELMYPVTDTSIFERLGCPSA